MEGLLHHPSLFGLGMGCGAHRVLQEEIADADGFEGYCIQNAKVGRKIMEGSFVEVSHQERIDLVLETGGWLRMKNCVTFKISSGCIDKIVFGHGTTALSSLTWRDESEMEQALGPADAREMHAFDSVHHYISQKVSIKWSTDPKRLEMVTIGDVWEDPQLTARDLVEQLAEGWKSLEEYNFEEPLASAQPVIIRYQRIRALAAALNLSIKSIADGSFLDSSEEVSRRNATLLRLESSVPHLLPPQYPSSKAKKIFVDLFSYRRKAEALLTHNSGWLECSDPALVAMIGQTESVNEVLREQLVSIEALLAELLDPNEQTFGQSWLVRTHGYNEISPKEYDTAWSWGFGFDIEE